MVLTFGKFQVKPSNCVGTSKISAAILDIFNFAR